MRANYSYEIAEIIIHASDYILSHIEAYPRRLRLLRADARKIIDTNDIRKIDIVANHITFIHLSNIIKIFAVNPEKAKELIVCEYDFKLTAKVLSEYNSIELIEFYLSRIGTYESLIFFLHGCWRYENLISYFMQKYKDGFGQELLESSIWITLVRGKNISIIAKFIHYPIVSNQIIEFLKLNTHLTEENRILLKNILQTLHPYS